MANGKGNPSKSGAKAGEQFPVTLVFTALTLYAGGAIATISAFHSDGSKLSIVIGVFLTGLIPPLVILSSRRERVHRNIMKWCFGLVSLVGSVSLAVAICIQAMPTHPLPLPPPPIQTSLDSPVTNLVVQPPPAPAPAKSYRVLMELPSQAMIGSLTIEVDGVEVPFEILPSGKVQLQVPAKTGSTHFLLKGTGFGERPYDYPITTNDVTIYPFT